MCSTLAALASAELCEAPHPHADVRAKGGLTTLVRLSLVSEVVEGTGVRLGDRDVVEQIGGQSLHVQMADLLRSRPELRRQLLRVPRILVAPIRFVTTLVQHCIRPLEVVQVTSRRDLGL